jgi:hypothetical protein
MTPLKDITTALDDPKNQLSMLIGTQAGTYIDGILNGNARHIGLSTLMTRTEGFGSFEVCKIIYSFTTGDPNGDN